jgi:hypothetical protein
MQKGGMCALDYFPKLIEEKNHQFVVKGIYEDNSECLPGLNEYRLRTVLYCISSSVGLCVCNTVYSKIVILQ